MPRAKRSSSSRSANASVVLTRPSRRSSQSPTVDATPLTSTTTEQSVLAQQPRALLWGVGVSFGVIVILWLGFLSIGRGSNQNNRADQALTNIGEVLSQIPRLADDLPGQLIPTNEDPKAAELRQQVFPEFAE